METLVEFQVAYDDIRYQVVLSAGEATGTHKHVDVIWSIRVGANGGVSPIKVHHQIDLHSRKVEILGLLGLTPFAACLAACGAAGLIGPLVGCFTKNPKKYIECLKTKGRAVAEDVIKCAIGCGSGSLAGASTTSPSL